MDLFKGDFSLKNCCRLLSLSRSSYYYQQSRPTLNQKYGYLKNDLKKVITDNPVYGYRRIKDALKNEHQQLINHKPLLKLLKDWDLSLKRSIRHKKPSGIEDILKEMGEQVNLLRTLKEDEIEPLKLFQTDFTKIAIECGSVYLFPYLDFKTKVVAGAYVSLDPTSEAALKAYGILKRFAKQQNIPMKEVIIHQDQGAVFTSYDYIGALVGDDITPSYSRVGKPQDNPGMEAFFGRLKDEWKNVFATAKNLDELTELVYEAIKYYNCKRIHSKTNGLSPINNLATILTS